MINYTSCIVESNETKNRYLIVNDNYEISEFNFKAVIYKDYKRLVNNSTYEFFKNENFHIMERQEFIKNFNLCLDI